MKDSTLLMIYTLLIFLAVATVLWAVDTMVMQRLDNLNEVPMDPIVVRALEKSA